MAQTIEEMQADRAVLVERRLAFLSGEQVKEVNRDGRRLVFANAGLSDFDKAIAALDAAIITATNEAAGRPRRRAITLGF